jgi:cellulose synthase (UDP-forming)
LDSLAINVAWAVHNLVVLFAAIAVACERPQLRAVHRTPVRLAAMLRLADGKTIRGHTMDLGREGASMSFVVKPRVVRRERVWLSIFAFGEERALPATVIARADKSLRVQFGELALDEEAHLVRAIFSRADAWLGWDARHRTDQPLRTLATIARVGISGVGRAMTLGLRSGRRRPLLPAHIRSEA